MMKSLFRKYGYLTVVALLCCAPMAFGQQVTMTLQSSVTGNPSEAGIYTGAYPFAPISINGTTITSAVCDDFADQIYIGESWTAQVNTFANIGSNVGSGGPMWGNQGSQQNATMEYQEAAWLVTQMPGNAGNAALVSDISYAIWQIFDPPGSAFQWLYNNGLASDMDDPTAKDTAAWWLAQAEMSSNYNSVNTSDFEILTPTGTPTCSGGPCPTVPPQEFLVYTPESSGGILLGADMLGLLGLIIVFRRRLIRPLV